MPFIDYNLVMSGGKPKPKRNPTQFVGDAHDGGYVNVGIANIIRGYSEDGDKSLLAMTTEGTFISRGRSSGSLLEGQRIKIGDVPIFVAEPGDIVYAPAQAAALAPARRQRDGEHGSNRRIRKLASLSAGGRRPVKEGDMLCARGVGPYVCVFRRLWPPTPLSGRGLTSSSSGRHRRPVPRDLPRRGI